MPSPSLTDPGGIEDLLLWRMSKVIALGGSIVTRLCEGQFGITRREWTVLAIAARADAMLWTELARRCEIDNARLSRAVSSLVSKKLLRKSHLPDRQVAVSLTPGGRDLYTRMFPLARDISEQMMAALDPQQIVSLERILQLLHDRGEQVVRETPVPKAGRFRPPRRDV